MAVPPSNVKPSANTQPRPTITDIYPAPDSYPTKEEIELIKLDDDTLGYNDNYNGYDGYNPDIVGDENNLTIVHKKSGKAFLSITDDAIIIGNTGGEHIRLAR